MQSRRRNLLPAAAAVLVVAVLSTLPAWGAAPTPRSIDDTCGSAPDAGFTDVPAANPHLPTIDCIKHYEVTSGKTATTYDPAGDLRRDQLATFLAATIRAGGGSLPTPTRDHFDDDDGNPHEGNIDRLAEAGIVDTTTRTFGVARIVSRAEMARLTIDAMVYVGVVDPDASVPDYFPDDEGLAEEDAINRIAHAGVAVGGTDGAFHPERTLRRDQMATFLARSIDLILDDGSAPEKPAPSPAPSPSETCDPSYPDVCIPSPPPDLNCADISYENFRVVGEDPHRFDHDGNGIGCET